MKRTLSLFSVILLSVISAIAGSEIYSDLTFVGSVSTGTYSAISGISAVATNGGYYTNAVVTTNYYRLCATNPAGRIPLSTNIVVAWTPGTGTNAIQLSWTRPGGVYRQVVERSLDGGVTWSNWLTTLPGASSWLDTGSNTWTPTIFTNAVSPIPAASYPWATVAQGAKADSAYGWGDHSAASYLQTDKTNWSASSINGSLGDELVIDLPYSGGWAIGLWVNMGPSIFLPVGNSGPAYPSTHRVVPEIGSVYQVSLGMTDGGTGAANASVSLGDFTNYWSWTDSFGTTTYKAWFPAISTNNLIISVSNGMSESFSLYSASVKKLSPGDAIVGGKLILAGQIQGLCTNAWSASKPVVMSADGLHFYWGAP